ncbi:transporter substrate-binding domain-containing protein, partial [Pseudomonas protegens]|uniref:transporter substrate-binding domain-containing protein n=1 Tax=Pseudomonas protegens TaxID=380021 RepID=UPI00223C4710
MQSILDVQRTSILQRWVPETYNTVKKDRITLSEQESRWLAKNPVVKVAAHGGVPPFSYFDSKGRFSGLAESVLENITSHTGLKFEVVPVRNSEEELALIDSGAADLLAMAIPNSYDEYRLSFTRPYSVSPYVLVSLNSESSGLDFHQLSDKYLTMCAKPTGHQLEGRLFAHSPMNSTVEFNDAEKLFAAVASKKMQAAVVPLKVASYMLSRGYDDRLRIYCALGEGPENITLATSRGALELFSILEKALTAISPMELVDMKNRTDATGISVFGFRESHGLSRLQSIYLSLLLAAVFGWALFLVYQIRARKFAEQALNDQLNLMRVLIDGLPHPIYVRDRTGRLVMCNHRYLKELGVNFESVVGKLVSESPYAEVIDAQSYQDEYLKLMQDGSNMSGDRQVKWHDGRTLTLYGWALPFNDSNG